MTEDSIATMMSKTTTNYHISPAGVIYNDTKPIVVKGPLMLTGDWHVPLIHEDAINNMIDTARREKITQLAIAGDYWNFDSLSQYDPKQQDHTLEDEIDRGVDIMRVLLKTFKRVTFTWGNHDARLHKSLGYKLPFSRAMKLMFQGLTEKEMNCIEFSDLDHFYINTPAGTWYVCHPSNYSRLPLATARKIAAKLPGYHVVTAHSHHHATGYAEDGVCVVAEIGGLFERKSTTYLGRSSTFPNWQNGYGWIDRNGKLHMVSDGWERS